MARRWDSAEAHSVQSPLEATKHGITDEDRARWDSKQDALKFDDAPTEYSDNVLKSSVVFTALRSLKNSLTAAYQKYVNAVNVDNSEHFEAIDTQLDAVATSLGSLNTSYNTINTALGEVGNRVTLLESIKENTTDSTYMLKPVTLEDVIKDTSMWLSDSVVDVGSGLKFSEYVGEGHAEPGQCIFKYPIKKGDTLIFSNAHTLSDVHRIVVVDENDYVVETVEYIDVMANIPSASYSTLMRGHYTFENSGMLYMGFRYTDVHAGEFFYIKSPSKTEPLVLYDCNSVVEDAAVGDAILKAIMEGRQVLVRVENADLNNYTAVYSPVYMYQLPNYMNDYLYLFYLQDAKQTLNLSALGMGTIQLPLYSQLKIKVSRAYNHSPLV